jgi:TonB family protein
LVQRDRLIGAARHFAAPLAISLAVHAALIGAIGPGGGELLSPASAAAAMQVRLAEAAPQNVAPPASVPVRRVGAPLPFRGEAPVRYLRSSELEERATAVEIAALVYPEKAYINRIAGTVRMRVYISDGGRVDRTEVVSAAPAGHFEQAAVDAIRRTTFKPARKDGRSVPSQKVVEVNFDPYGLTPEDRP